MMFSIEARVLVPSFKHVPVTDTFGIVLKDLVKLQSHGIFVLPVKSRYFNCLKFANTFGGKAFSIGFCDRLMSCVKLAYLAGGRPAWLLSNL